MPSETEDRFAMLLKKWEQESREDLKEANKERLDFLNKIDNYDSFQEIQQEISNEASKEWYELPLQTRLRRITG